MRIGYFADGPWAHKALDLIVNDEEFSLQFICGRFDRRDHELMRQATDFNIPFIQLENVNSPKSLDTLKDYDCDLFVSMSFNQIFKNEFLAIPAMGVINCHAGKLPFYRGRNVLNWVLINDEKEFGVTIHYVDKGVDTGDIISQETYAICDQDTYATLLTRAYEACATLLYESLQKMAHEQVTTIQQQSIHPVGFYCSIRQDGDELINWDSTSREVFNFVRALTTPGPMARTWLGDCEISIRSAKLIEDYPTFKGLPGCVIGRSADGFIVKTRDSALLIDDWVCIRKIKLGDRLK